MALSGSGKLSVRKVATKCTFHIALAACAPSANGPSTMQKTLPEGRTHERRREASRQPSVRRAWPVPPVQQRAADRVPLAG